MATKLKPLNEQVVVITGASSGIGLATAEEAAKQGAKLVLAARSKNTLDEIVQRITSAGTEAVAVECDVSDRQQVESVATAAIGRFGRIDTWVNNAGLGMYGRLDETPEADAKRLFDINFWGVVNGCQAALPHLKRNGGALINVGSEVSDAYIPVLGIYVASKHAVKGYTDVLRVEVEEVDKAPVSITLIQPTATDTPFPEHARNFMDHDAKLPTPMIDPQRVAEAILDAAVSPTREKTVGAMAKVNKLLSKVAPGLADKMSAHQTDRMHRDAPPRNPEGALDQPSEALATAGRTHGACEKKE
ncbi:short-chain dehydrogenase [Planctomyces sp. SCGC AG-212-M04]|nr:short-chain dehydrogenase [Planctomyces sp. SCGC AG-212-M04]